MGDAETTTAVRRRRSPEARERQLVDDLALFAVCLSPERAAELLQGLASGRRKRALEQARKLAALDARSRQGRLLRQLGQRPEASERVRRLMAESPEGLQRVLYARLPRYHQTLFPALEAREGRGELPADAQVALTDRLIREATG
jgi:hypothetical protein